MVINMRILLVEDNESIILGLEYLLRAEGYETESATTLEAAQQALACRRPDLVLLDVSLPDGNGFRLCRSIREEAEVPVIFLTAREEEADVVRGFELGAEDYVIKPFRNRELVCRIKNVLRRCAGEGTELSCGDIRLDTASGRVFRGQEEILLTKLEYKILLIMMSSPGRLFSREEILAGIWDIQGNFVNDNTLTVTMKRLREKIDDRDGNVIVTVRGMGYRLQKPTA